MYIIILVRGIYNFDEINVIMIISNEAPSFHI